MNIMFHPKVKNKLISFIFNKRVTNKITSNIFIFLRYFYICYVSPQLLYFGR